MSNPSLKPAPREEVINIEAISPEEALLRSKDNSTKSCAALLRRIESQLPDMFMPGSGRINTLRFEVNGYPPDVVRTACVVLQNAGWQVTPMDSARRITIDVPAKKRKQFEEAA